MGKTDIPDVVAATQSIARLDFNKHKHKFTSFVDRGDPAAPDFDHVTLIGDFAWRDLDLSAIVGARSCLVGIRVALNDSVAGSFIELFTKGNVEWPNAAVLLSQAAWIFIRSDLWVFTDATGKIQYAGSWTGDIFVSLTIFTWSL